MSRFPALQQPLINLITVATISLLVALLTFLLGGSLAEVADQEGKFLGFTFEAGGALAGFVLVFLLSSHELRRFQAGASNSSVAMKVPAVDSEPTSFLQSKQYVCKYTLFDTQTGSRREVPANYTWEAGFLTVFVPGVGSSDLVRIRVEDGQIAWESEDFAPLTRRATITRVS